MYFLCFLKKKEETWLENEIMSVIKRLEDNENNVHQLEEKRQEMMELRKKKVDHVLNGYTKENRIQNTFVILKKDILYRRQCVLFKKMMGHYS